MFRLFLLIPVTFALFGPASSAPEGAKKPVFYFPVQKGTRWVFQWKEGDRKTELVEVVTDADGLENEEMVVTVGRVGAGGKVTPDRKYWISQRGIEQTLDLGDIAQRWSLELKMPHKAGQSWQTGGPNGPTFTAYGPEKVKVPAGEYDAIRVEQHLKGEKKPSVVRYYAPGVGPVKLLMDQDLVVELKSFTPGKK